MSTQYNIVVFSRVHGAEHMLSGISQFAKSEFQAGSIQKTTIFKLDFFYQLNNLHLGFEIGIQLKQSYYNLLAENYVQ